MPRTTRAHIALALAAALAACSRGAPAPARRADPMFVNGGFEDNGGSLTGWTITRYANTAGLTVYPPTTVPDLALAACGAPSTGNNPECVNRTDAEVNAVPESQQMAGLSGLVSPRWPKFGTSTAVVNKQGLHQNVNSLKQRYTTTSADVDANDGKIHARFALSPQLQNPSHIDRQQPYFYVALRNLTKGTTLYQTFNYSNQPGIPWQTTADAVPVLYTDWQLFDIAPGNAALMIGDTVELEVIAAGCQPNGHWGQVYVDGFGAQLPGLSISKSAPAWVLANADLTYTFQVENGTSFEARNVVASEVIPANTTFKSIVPPAGVTCTTPAVDGTGTVSCPLGWMNPYSSQTFQVTVHTATGLANGTVITNGNYSVVGDGINSVLGPAVMTTVGNGPYADLAVTVSDGVPAVVWGGPVQYLVTATNYGPTTATNATVTDTFPAQLTGVSWTCAATGGGSCGTASGSGNLTAANGKVTLPPGATATYTVNATVVSGSGNGTLTNGATVATPVGVTDSLPGNNTDADVDSIGTLYTVTVTKDLSETGRGRVISSPTGISCGDACASQSTSFLDGSQVTLTAIARPGDTFDGWTGDCTAFGTANLCTVTLSGAALNAGAHFRGPAVTGSAPGGNGSVTCAPSPVLQQTSSTCAIAPAAGYQLTALTDNGTDVLASVSGGTYAISGAALVNDHAVVATFMKSDATGCVADAECASGSCTDGVCCDSACTGQCQACDLPGKVGTCSPVTGAPAGGRPACASDGSACGGACDGSDVNACAYPDASTACRSASCSNGTATLAVSCDGSGSCPAATTQACNPYVCGATACLTACGDDSQCASGDYCNGTACVSRIAQGGACTAPHQCATGSCVDGVCCDVACGGQCQACNVAGKVGTCSPVTSAPVGARPACTTDGTLCGTSACDGIHPAACTYPGAATACRAGSCAGGTGTLPASCDGLGHCPAVQTQACSPFVCGANACLTACTGDADCIAGDFCKGSSCQPRRADGQTCAGGDECVHGNCVDGVCCDVACGGQCQACNLPSRIGTCSPVTGAPAGGRPACATDGSACGGASNGTLTSSCSYPSGSVACRTASCSAGVATGAASCDGAGSCPAQTQACGAYVCGPTACLTSCTADGQCAAGDFCSGGACVPRLAPGQACTAAGQCLGGHCADGVCCDAPCDGQCEACNVSGREGTCSPVTGAPVGARPACASDGSACGGACDGVRRNVCGYPGEGLSCRAASCAGGTATLGETCDGQGRCPALQTQSCAPNACAGTLCAGGCLSGSDCATGQWCSAGVCVTKLGAGAACGADGQCATGHCVDGVCCDAACGGQCEACNLPGHAGTCSAVSGAPVDGRTPCAGDGSICSGTCDGAQRAACAYPRPPVSCRGPSCEGGVATLSAACDGAGRCPAVQVEVCAPHLCSATACAGDCSADAQCAAGSWCAGGVCTPKIARGGACGASSQCASGHCVDGFCCDRACTGQCEACGLFGAEGTCSAVTGAPAGARPACAGDGSNCEGMCDGASGSACAYPGTAVECRAPACAGGVGTASAFCDGAGSCPTLRSQTCSPYVCGPSACDGDCAADPSSCAAGSFCSAGVCVPKLGAGQACGGDGQCTSGHCADGVCCNTACGGTCEACDVAGHAGVCTAVMGSPHGARPACASDGSACGGACDGTGRAACAYPGTSTLCSAAACDAGVATSAAACAGAGSCPAARQVVCATGTCDGVACAQACSVDADCPSGHVCSGGACVEQSGWRMVGGGCSAAGGPPLAPLALVALLLLPLGRRGRRGARSAAALLALGVAALPLAARAQSETAVNAERFEPLGGARDLLAVPSARTAGHLEASGAVFADYGAKPLKLVPVAGGGAVDLVDSQVNLALTASLGLLDAFELSAALPFAVAGSGMPASSADPSLSPATPGSGLGDLRLTPKFQLAGGREGFAFALLAPVTFPTATALYLGQGVVTVSPRAAVETGRAGGWRFVADAGAVLRSTKQFLSLDVGSALAYGAAFELPFASGRAAALATVSGEAGRGASARALEALAAVRIAGPAGLSFTVGGGPGLSSGYGTPQYRMVFAVSFDRPRSAAAEPEASAAPGPAAAPATATAARVEAGPTVAVGPARIDRPQAAAAPDPAPVPGAPGPGTLAVLKKSRIMLLEPVDFVRDRDALLPESLDVLKDVAAVLRAHPEVTRLRVEAHTDDDGTAAHLLDLSQRRAVAVREFLVKNGVEAKRLDARGYGDTRPVTTNYSREDRARNRRIELWIQDKQR